MRWMKSIRKRLWLLLLLPALAAGSAYIMSTYVLSPVYEADLRLYINGNPANINSDSMLTRQYFVKDYRELIKSRAVILPVIKELQLLGVNPSELAEDITVDAINNTNLLEIRVKGSSPSEAVRIADCVGSVFIREVKRLLTLENVSIVDSAIPPEEPESPDVILNTAVALAAGILAAFGLIFLSEYLDRTLRTGSDVEESLQLPVLGFIPKY